MSDCSNNCSEVSFIRLLPIRYGNYVMLVGRNFNLQGWKSAEEPSGTVLKVEVFWDLRSSSNITAIGIPTLCDNKLPSERTEMKFESQIGYSQLSPQRNCTFNIGESTLQQSEG
jgi:hypothetical protein